MAGESIVPISGIIIPVMGTNPNLSVADALFTPVQQRVLGLLFGQPHRRFQSAEIIHLVDSGTGAVHRQLQRLAQVGLVETTRIGNQKHYQARSDSPVFEELHRLVIKTIAVVEPLRTALAPHSERIQAAFVFGSLAKGEDRVGSDLDLMVLSDVLTYPDVYESVHSTERILARPINPTVMTPADWHRKRAEHDSFVARIADQPKLFVVGSESDLD